MLWEGEEEAGGGMDGVGEGRGGHGERGRDVYGRRERGERRMDRVMGGGGGGGMGRDV